MKRCKKCKKQKPETEFYPYKRSADKLDYSCKTCHKTASVEYRKKRYKTDPQFRLKILKLARKYRKDHPIISRRASRKYYYKNREKVLEQKKIYRENNLGSIKKLNSEWQLKNRNKLKLYLREWRLKNPEKYKEYYKKYSSKKKALVLK